MADFSITHTEILPPVLPPADPGNYGVDLLQHLTPSIAPFQQIIALIMQSLRVAVPAVVKSFDPTAGTVTVQIATNERILMNASGGQFSTPINLNTQSLPSPLLQDVPVQMPGAGGFVMTFPIQPGDECMVIFQDTPLDAWFQNGGVNNNQVSQRRHSLADPIAVFGLRSTPNAITDWSADSVQLRSDDATVIIEVKDGEANVTAPTVNVTGGTVNITGTTSIVIGAATNTMIEGGSYLNHRHIDGGGVGLSGPVFPGT